VVCCTGAIHGCKSLVLKSVCLDLSCMGVCDVDERFDAPTERLYLDDRLVEDFDDAGEPPASGLPVAHIECGRRWRPWLRAVVYTFGGVLVTLAVSVAVRSRVVRGHNAGSAAKRAAGPQPLERHRRVVDLRRPPRPIRRVARPHIHHRRSRESTRRVYPYTRLPNTSAVPAAPAQTVQVPVRRSARVLAPRGEEFGFER
jgi:hypothetical protein